MKIQDDLGTKAVAQLGQALISAALNVTWATASWQGEGGVLSSTEVEARSPLPGAGVGCPSPSGPWELCTCGTCR